MKNRAQKSQIQPILNLLGAPTQDVRHDKLMYKNIDLNYYQSDIPFEFTNTDWFFYITQIDKQHLVVHSDDTGSRYWCLTTEQATMILLMMSAI